jgi:hypothetical protein
VNLNEREGPRLSHVAAFSGQPWNRFKCLTVLVSVAFAVLSVCGVMASAQVETGQISEEPSYRTRMTKFKVDKDELTGMRSRTRAESHHLSARLFSRLTGTEWPLGTETSTKHGLR